MMRIGTDHRRMLIFSAAIGMALPAYATDFFLTPLQMRALCQYSVSERTGEFASIMGGMDDPARSMLIQSLDDILHNVSGQGIVAEEFSWATLDVIDLFRQLGMSTDSIEARVRHRLQDFFARAGVVGFPAEALRTSIPRLIRRLEKGPANESSRARIIRMYGLQDYRKTTENFADFKVGPSAASKSYIASLDIAHRLASEVKDTESISLIERQLFAAGEYRALAKVLQRSGEPEALVNLSGFLLARFFDQTGNAEKKFNDHLALAIEILSLVGDKKRASAEVLLREIGDTLSDPDFYDRNLAGVDLSIAALHAYLGMGQRVGQYPGYSNSLGKSTLFIHRVTDARIRQRIREVAMAIHRSRPVATFREVHAALAAISATDDLVTVGEKMFEMGNLGSAILSFAYAGRLDRMRETLTEVIRRAPHVRVQPGSPNYAGETEGYPFKLTAILQAYAYLGKIGEGEHRVREIWRLTQFPEKELEFEALAQKAETLFFGNFEIPDPQYPQRWWNIRTELSRRIRAAREQLTTLSQEELTRRRMRAMDAIGEGDIRTAEDVFISLADSEGLFLVAKRWRSQSEPMNTLTALLASRIARMQFP